MKERTDIVTFKGNPVTLLGPALRVGEPAPDFTLIDGTLNTVTLADFKGRTKIICTVPSLDTPVCDTEARRFNQEAAALDPNIVVLVVSLDLPFAQNRWCGGAGIDRIVTLSDYRERSFGGAYGVLIKELLLLSRSVFVVDKDDIITFVQHVAELTEEPDYAAVLDAARGPQIAVSQLPVDGVCGAY